MRETHTHTKFLRRKNVNLEHREGDERITLTYISGRQVVRRGNPWNWLRIVSNDGLCN